MLETTVTLELSTDDDTLRDLEPALDIFRILKGIVSVQAAQVLPSARWVTLKITIQGKDHKALQRLYTRVTNVGGKPPFKIHGRGCILNEMFEARGAS